MIVGFSGRMGAGKDTVAKMLMDRYDPIGSSSYNGNFQIRRAAFADKLKESATKSLGLDPKLADKLKLEGSILVTLPGLVHEITGRQYYQYSGTEGGRDVFGENIWVDQVMREDSPSFLWLITDMRFPNEVEAVKARGGYCVRVNRKEADEKPILHASEQLLPPTSFDWHLHNDGGFDELAVEVDTLVERLERIFAIKLYRNEGNGLTNIRSQLAIGGN